MPPKKKPLGLVKPARVHKPAMVKEQSGTMTKKEWDHKQERVKFGTLDRKRRHHIQIEKEARAAATFAMSGLGLDGGDSHVYQAALATRGSTNSPSYSAYSKERYPSTPLSQIRFSNEMADNGASIPINLNQFYYGTGMPPLRQAPTDGHVTDGTCLPRIQFSDDSIYRDAPNTFEQMTGERFEFEEAMNEASQFQLYKMKEEASILMADLSRMDPLARAWHEMYRETRR